MNNLTPEDLEDLKSSLRSDPPVNFKGSYSLAHQSKGIARMLQRHGIAVRVAWDTGEITLEKI